MELKRSSGRGVRAVAIFEASKGAIVLLAGMGLLSLIHHDVQGVAEKIVHTLHLDPARRYPRIFIDAATRVGDTHLLILAVLAFTYALVRFIEAYGLWRFKVWAEWFGILSGGVYLPLEVYEIYRHVTIIRVGALLINAVIVAYLLYVRLTGKIRPLEGRPGSSRPGAGTTTRIDSGPVDLRRGDDAG